MKVPTLFKNKNLLQKKHYNVIVIGAGPAGSSCAIRLLQKGIKDVLLVESGDFEKFRIGESIPPHTKQLFYKLGIYDDFVKEKHLVCYGNASAWGSDKLGYNDFMIGGHGNGWHLDRQRFDRFLAKKAEDFGATFFRKTTFQSSNKTTNGFELILKNENGKEQVVFADYVIDATGKRGIFAAQQGSTKIHTLPVVSLGMRFLIEKKASEKTKLTHLEAAKEGWWYTAQIPNNQMLVALYSDAETIKNYKLNKTENWLSFFKKTKHLYPLLENCQLKDAQPMGFAAPSYLLDKPSGKNWMAIGDAASAYDPLLAQGIIKSIWAAMFSADTLVKKIAGEVDSFDEYDQFIQQKFGSYINLRTRFYRMEERWSDTPFWKRLREEKVKIML